MTSTFETTRVAQARWGWRIVLSVAALLTVNGIALYAFVMDTHQERTIAILVAGLGLQALVVAVAGLRSSAPWAWNATWALFAVLVAIGIHVLAGGGEDPAISVWYFLLGALVLAGQLMNRAGR